MNLLADTAFWLMPMVLLATAAPVVQAARAPDERARMRTWVRRHLAGDDGPPFSLMIGGVPAQKALMNWRKTFRSHRLDARRTAHTAIWTDEASGLRLRLDATEFADAPSVE